MILTSIKPYSWWLFFLAALLFCPSSALMAQKRKKEKEPKTAVKLKEHSPHKATLWALLPGAGQIYNKKYWKLPIVYAGFGVIGYFIIQNRNEYLKFNNAYICSANADSDTSFVCEDPLGSRYETAYLQSYRDYYRRNLELSYIILGAWYLLQMLDATVDAHLFHWEVDENLSLRLDPVVQPAVLARQRPAYSGLKLTLSF